MESSVLAGDPARIWHLYWQAAVGRDLLSDPALAARIRSRVLAAHRSAGRELLYYLLMPTEIHLLTALGAGDSAGALAQGMVNVISRWVREVQGLRGPVFAGGYQAAGISTVEELRDEIRMLAWRPVAMRLCAAVTHYRHSALRIALGYSSPEGFNATALLGFFGRSVHEGRAGLRNMVARRPCALEALQWEFTYGLDLAPGSIGPIGPTSRPVGRSAAALVAASESKGIDGALQLLERWVQAKLGPSPGQGPNVQNRIAGARHRALVAIFAVRSGLCPAASVARHFKRARATLSEQMTACRRRPADRQILAIPISRVVQEAIELALMVNRQRTCIAD